MPVESTHRISELSYEISTKDFTVIADVSENLGGGNKGPGPHDYLQISLAACTAMTLQMYAKRKSLPLESVDVKIEITKEGLENSIRRDIKLNGELNEEQRTALFVIAEKCPMHNFITRGAKIESHLVGATLP